MSNDLSSELNKKQILKYSKQISKLSNQAKYDQAYDLSLRLLKKYPKILKFQIYEAIFTAEKTEGFSKKQLAQRYEMAVQKLQKVLFKLRGTDLNTRAKAQNEYYWFSKQPQKQYKLGVKVVKLGLYIGFYSQGVGAAMVARQYAMVGKSKFAHRWARTSEKAWLNYFKHQPNWYNSYLFYAIALGIQKRFADMEDSLDKARKIAQKPKSWSLLNDYRVDVKLILDKMDSKSKR